MENSFRLDKTGLTGDCLDLAECIEKKVSDQGVSNCSPKPQIENALLVALDDIFGLTQGDATSINSIYINGRIPNITPNIFL